MINLALIQHSFKGSKQATIDFTLEKIAESAQNGANLVALQELHTSEYFCQREDVGFFSYAESFEREKRIFADSAKKHKIVLVTSLFEKRAKGLYHNTAVVFEKDGSIAGQYRKMHIPDDPSFYEKFYFTPGDNDFKPIQTSLGKIGVLICWDQWFPEAARLMALSGAEIIIYPTAIGWDLNDSQDEKQRQLEAWKAVQRGHAVANGVFVCAINRHGIETCGANSASCGDFLGSASARFVNEPTSSISSLASHNPKNSSTILEFASCKNAESGLDSAESQNLIKKPCHSERCEESKNNPSLRADSQNLRGNPPIKKTQDLQDRLPRSHSLARNDEILDSSLRKCSAQNDNVGLDSAPSKQEANSAITDEFLGFCEASDEYRTLVHRGSEPKQSLKSRCESEFDAIHFWGNSFIFGPQGELLALASEDKDEILQVKIDLRRISQVRNIWPFLRDRRIDFYGNLTKRFID